MPAEVFGDAVPCGQRATLQHRLSSFVSKLGSLSSAAIFSRFLPTKYRLLNDKIFSVSYFEDISRKVFPVFALGLALEELHVPPVLRVPTGELPIDNDFYLFILHDDVAWRKVGVGGPDAAS